MTQTQDAAVHRRRMTDLVAYTATSLETDYPSPFGSAVYDAASGALISRAYDTVMQACDPTNHAEVNAVRAAPRALGRLSLAGTVLYSTCEPCPMCMSACIWAEVDTVVYGASTMEDADRYWPQPSPVTPQYLVSQTVFEKRCTLVPHVARDACRALFERCDALRVARGLALPPHRGGPGSSEPGGPA